MSYYRSLNELYVYVVIIQLKEKLKLNNNYKIIYIFKNLSLLSINTARTENYIVQTKFERTHAMV